MEVSKPFTVFCSIFAFSLQVRMSSFSRAYLCLIRFRLTGLISLGEDVPVYPRASSVADPFPNK